MQQLFGPRFGRLFRLTIRKRQSVPDPTNFDNARYLVFECSGGYPIVIMAVGFNFYGRRDWPRIGIVNRAWEAIHNRVTGNVLNEFKHDCESRCSR
jgi:hypothetical protein